MARDYMFRFTAEVANEEERENDDYGQGFGSRVTLKNLTDEQIAQRADDWAGFMRNELYRLRDKEAKRDRELAKPFWMKWVGA